MREAGFGDRFQNPERHSTSGEAGDTWGDRIRERSARRARALMEYLCAGGEEEFQERKAAFFRWFSQERYSWYGILVLEECRRLAGKEEAFALFESLAEPGSRMMLGMLYRRNGRWRDYYRLCAQTAEEYRGFMEKEEGALLPGADVLLLLQQMSAEAGERAFFEEKDYLRAGSYYELYFLYGGKRESICRKYRRCMEEGFRPAFHRIENGYVVGKAISAGAEKEKYFVGREELIEDYYRRLTRERTGMLVFYGQYRVGKTSVLENLKAALEKREPGREMLIHVSMEDFETESAFYEGVMKNICTPRRNRKYTEFIRSLPRELTRISGQPDFERFQELLEQVGEAFREWYGNPFRVILFVDEFMAAVGKPGIDDRAFLRRLKGLVDRDMLQVVITGPESFGEYISQGGARNLLPYKLPYLSREAVKRLLEEPVRKLDGGSRYEREPQVMERIYELTGGNPMLTQAIAYDIVNRLNERRQEDVTGEILEEVVDAVLRKDHGIWRARFAPLLDCEMADGQWEEEDVIAVCGKLQKAWETGAEFPGDFQSGLSELQKKVYAALRSRDIIRLNAQMQPYVEVALFGKWCCYEMA